MYSLLKKIVVINPKGGSGKTTIATNLAAYYAHADHRVALLDHDSQGSSTQWVKRRAKEAGQIHCVSMYEVPVGVTRSFAQQLPADVDRVVVDTPAALKKQDYAGLLRGADKIIVPVLPSEIDIHAATRTAADLLLTAKIDRRERRLAVVANRVRSNTIMFRTLMKFLDSLDIPIVGQFRDTQNYVRAAQSGCGIIDLPPSQVAKDLLQWQQFVCWLEADRNELQSPWFTRRQGT